MVQGGVGSNFVGSYGEAIGEESVVALTCKAVRGGEYVRSWGGEVEAWRLQ